MERATGTEVYGCGSSHSTDITLNIQTTTGGNFTISLSGKNTVESLKKMVSKKLRVSKDRICLLHRDRQLRDGTLDENGLLDGSKVILLPSVETGLLSQKPENSVMQALESLNDAQVNDFLSGKSPLNLTMRLGDHMMLIQLQLSTLNSRTLKSSLANKANTQLRTPSKRSSDSSSSESTPEKKLINVLNSSISSESNKILTEQLKMPTLKKKDLEILQNAFDLCRSMAEEKFAKKEESNSSETPSESQENEQSPIKSLSNLVSSPLVVSTTEATKSLLTSSIKSSLIEMLNSNLGTDTKDQKPTLICSDKPCDTSTSSEDSDNFTDQSSFLAESTIDEYPMENLFNNAVDKGLFKEGETMMDREISNLATTSHGKEASVSGTLPSFQCLNEPLKTKRFHYLLHKTSKFKHPIGQNKQKAFMQSVVNKHKKKRMNNDQNQPQSSRTEPFVSSRKLVLQPSTSQEPQPSTSKQSIPPKTDSPPMPDTKTLLEASKNLTQTLKKLSKEVLTNKDIKATEENFRSRVGPGAVIESMKHHGKGIYSGTFSGTLNPALQDRFGRPKRDISTIIHILNDLLCASPPITLSKKDSTHSCAIDSKKCNKCSKTCTYGKCDGHSQPKGCKECKSSLDTSCTSCTEGKTCKKCDSAKSLAIENSKTKCKLEQLRLVMQQKKQRREARKLKTLPYTSPPKIGAADSGPIQEEIESLA